jgi:adenylate cyclase
MALRLLRKASIPVLLALAAIALCAVFYRAPLGSLTFANRLMDLRVHAEALRNPGSFGLRNAPTWEEPNDSIGLIELDELTMHTPGFDHFPYPRSVYGTLLERLARAGAKAAAFDIVFIDPAADPAQDRAFADGGAALPATIGYTITTTQGTGIPAAQIPPSDLQATLHIGYTSVDSPGGILLDYPLQIKPVADVPGGVADSLALSAAETYKGVPIDLGKIPMYEGAPLILPFDAASSVLGHAQDYKAKFAGQSISFADAMTEPIADLRVFAQNRVILIGATAQAMQDFAPSFYGQVPGMYFHARMIDQLLRNTFIDPASDAVNLSLLIVLPLLLVLMVLQLRPLVAAPLSIVAVLVYAETSIALFVYKLYWLDLVHVAAAMLLASFAAIAYRAIGEAAQKRAVTTAFGLHVSPGVVAELLKHEGSASDALAGKSARVTIFYSDIRGFTSMSEKLSAEAVYDQLNEYFEAMCDVIFKYGGYVDKFIGDCIMAIFSAPNPTEDDAVKAVHAALEQQKLIEQMAQRWREAGKPPLSVGMGINTGNVVMGNLGSQKRMNYTVIGDAVNTAARLYNVAKGGQIIISESTWEETKDFFEFRELEPVTVKGKAQPLRTFEVLGRKGEVPPETVQQLLGPHEPEVAAT